MLRYFEVVCWNTAATTTEKAPKELWVDNLKYLDLDKLHLFNQTPFIATIF